jgi:hypothetical protein
MEAKKFSKWVKFKNRKELTPLGWVYPGIYAIAYSKNDISNSAFSLIEDIVYFGMTNSKAGLKGRLQQFENTISGKQGHGGAVRFCYNLSKEDSSWKDKLYVSIMVFRDCDVESNNYKDLMLMGEVAKEEYVWFAKYVKKFKKLPRFNDKKKSPKKAKQSPAGRLMLHNPYPAS